MPVPFANLPPDRRGRIDRLFLHAPCLDGNPWGDPSTREVLVWSPPGAHDALPNVLILPGFAGTLEGPLGSGLLDVSLPARLDALIDAGCAPVRAVIPDVMTSVGGSQFLDSPGIGNYQTFLVDTVMPGVEAAFPSTGAWGAVGRSSGAFGAFHLALRAPEKVRAVAWHAGDCAFDLCYLEDLPKAVRGVLAAGGVDAFLQGFWSRRTVGGDAFAALNILAMSCAYDPDPARSPLPARLPFDPATGAVDFAALQRWSVFDPVTMVRSPAVCEALRGLDLFFLDAGSQDEYLLHLGARRLVAGLIAGSVPHTYEEFPGGHRGTAWRYDVSLPQVAAALTASRRR